MPCYDNDGSSSRIISTIYDNDGSTNRLISSVYDNDATTNRIVYQRQNPTIDNGNQSGAGGGWNLVGPARNASTGSNLTLWHTGNSGSTMTWGFAYSKNTIDLTGYTYLNLTWSSTWSGVQGIYEKCFGINTPNVTTAVYPTINKWWYADWTGTVQLPISQYNGLYRVWLGVGTANMSDLSRGSDIIVQKVWLS